LEQGGLLLVWDVKTGRKVASTWQRYIYAAAASSDNRHICVCSREGKFLVIDIDKDRNCGAWHDTDASNDGEESVIRGIDFSPDGKKVASYSKNGMIKIWDTSDFTESESSGDHSPQQPHDPYLDNLRRDNDWVKTTNGKLSFWVPRLNRKGLWLPRNTTVIGENLTKLDLTKFEYGNNWEKCRDKQ